MKQDFKPPESDIGEKVLNVGVSCNWRSLVSCNTLAGLNAAGGTRTGEGVETNIGTNEQRYRCGGFSCRMGNSV